MANHLINQAYACELRPALKFILVVLADMANSQSITFPSIARLQVMTGYSKRAVIDAIAELEEAKHIKKFKRFCKLTNSQKTNFYVIQPQLNKSLFAALFESKKETAAFIEEALGICNSENSDLVKNNNENQKPGALDAQGGVQEMHRGDAGDAQNWSQMHPNHNLIPSNHKDKKTRATALLSLEEYIQKQREQDLDSVPSTASCFALVEERGMPIEAVVAAWQYLIETYAGEPDKKQKDWMRVLSNCIKSNWGHNWKFDPQSKVYSLTQMGQSRVHAFELAQSKSNGGAA